VSRVVSRILGADGCFPRLRGWRYASCLGSLLSLGCALIDPIDPIPTGHGAASSANGGASAATGGALGGFSGSGGNGGMTPNTSGTAGVAPAERDCVVNADCESNARCLPEHVCVRLDTRDPATGTTGPCPTLLNAQGARDPNAIFIGAFAPLDQSSIEAQTISAIYAMAASEFNDMGGLRGVAGGPPSPLVVIVCNNSEASTPGALQHLIEDVRVPAVLAAMDQNQLLAGFNKYPQTFFVSAFSGSKELANVSRGRAWTMLGQPSDYAEIYAALLPHAEALVHAGLIRAGKDRDLRVAAVVETSNAFGVELANAVLPQLTFNGLKAVDQPSNYLGREVVSDGSNVQQVVKDLYDQLPPDIVLSFASDVFTANSGVMSRLNQLGWSEHRPLYILSPENAEAGADVTAELFRLRSVDYKDDVGRVLGVAPAGLLPGMTDAFNNFWMHLLLKYPEARTDFGNYYDAFYFLVDALYASPRVAFREGTINASDLATGMRRLTNLGKTKFNVGPNDISDVFSVLDAKNFLIQLDGTMGAPDFDRDTGMRRESGSIYCFDSTRLKIQKDVISYRRDTMQLDQVEHPLCLINFLNR
jgi:hypothetical protein